MAVSLNERAADHATTLINEGEVVADTRDEWSEHQPSTNDENRFIDNHGIREYAKWHLGIEDEDDEDNKGSYKFPYGDFAKVHRCAVLAAESRAAQYHHNDVQNGAAHLHGMIERREVRA